VSVTMPTVKHLPMPNSRTGGWLALVTNPHARHPHAPPEPRRSRDGAGPCTTCCLLASMAVPSDTQLQACRLTHGDAVAPPDQAQSAASR